VRPNGSEFKKLALLLLCTLWLLDSLQLQKPIFYFPFSTFAAEIFNLLVSLFTFISIISKALFIDSTAIVAIEVDVGSVGRTRCICLLNYKSNLK
jgi:hypothetical protein